MIDMKKDGCSRRQQSLGTCMAPAPGTCMAPATPWGRGSDLCKSFKSQSLASPLTRSSVAIVRRDPTVPEIILLPVIVLSYTDQWSDSLEGMFICSYNVHSAVLSWEQRAANRKLWASWGTGSLWRSDMKQCTWYEAVYRRILFCSMLSTRTFVNKAILQRCLRFLMFSLIQRKPNLVVLPLELFAFEERGVGFDAVIITKEINRLFFSWIIFSLKHENRPIWETWHKYFLSCCTCLVLLTVYLLRL